MFRDLLTARTGEFVEEVLVPHFGGMITFVKDCENLADKGQLDTMVNQEGACSDYNSSCGGSCSSGDCCCCSNGKVVGVVVVGSGSG